MIFTEFAGKAANVRQKLVNWCLTAQKFSRDRLYHSIGGRQKKQLGSGGSLDHIYFAIGLRWGHVVCHLTVTFCRIIVT